ncbi:MAG TPA: hypothetical protein DCQ31_16635 [Bacteroidales bacterium]|nr:hypothetical protein [Bacteroidales bacterium]
MNWRDYITTDSKILNGKPIIKSTRISVELILELFALGWTYEMIFESYPQLSIEQIRSVFLFLKENLETDRYFSFAKTA